MTENPSRRGVLKSVGEAGVVTTTSVFASCAGSDDSETETRQTARMSPSSESAASETPTLCEDVFGEWSTPGGTDTETPACANVDLDVVVVGRPETPTPTDSTSTPTSS